MTPLLLLFALDPAGMTRVEAAVEAAIKEGQAPGAVVVVLRHGEAPYRRAFGVRAAGEPMTLDTVFDLASLTKPMATAASVMKLVEAGKLRVSDPANKYVPGFKSGITLEHLLLHTSGLPAGSPVKEFEGGADKATKHLVELSQKAEPGRRFVYSDLGYILLGQIVEKVGGQPLDVFSAKEVFAPLAMKETTFKPAKELHPRIAPTEKGLRGSVHDPRARALGGVAGHAGLFGTADDVARFAVALLDGKFLSPAASRLMTASRDVPGGLRTYGWDVRTSYSSNRGEFFGGFGHTGFTGTSVWADPASGTVVVVMTSRLQNPKGNVVKLRHSVATLVARAISTPPYPDGRALPVERPAREVLCGIDVLKRDGFKALKGAKVALVTNHTGRDRDGVSTIDLLHKAEGVKLVALFSPEHGLRGLLDAPVPDGKDARTGLPVYSLYGKVRKPTKEQLAGVDTLVYDIQDVGCRFYTYSSTLGLVLEAAAEHKVRVVVLDRPNPVGGEVVEGPVRDEGRQSFVAYHTVPLRHGLTVGELARLFDDERKVGAKVEVVKLEGWRRADLFDATGLTWADPSPNMRSLSAALLYPGVGLLETTNVSVGRGTDTPFEVVGAPWIDGRRLAAKLNGLKLGGVRFVPARFTPAASVHAKKECGGVRIYLDDWSRLRAVPVGLALIAALHELHPKEWDTKRLDTLLVCGEMVKAVEKGEDADALARRAEAGVEAFLLRRKKALLYE